jgi:hypothetical protein
MIHDGIHTCDGSCAKKKESMREKVWAFDQKEVNKFVRYIIHDVKVGQMVRDLELRDFIQSACEAHAKVEIKKFGEEIRLDWNGDRWFMALDETIDAALKSRGIE